MGKIGAESRGEAGCDENSECRDGYSKMGATLDAVRPVEAASAATDGAACQLRSAAHLLRTLR